ncbi:MAG: hypothetical protein HOP11_09145 [Saprospiraceae bacterium]|nr:hypothetical protein [Saprospiraceae bacterium]
MKFTVLLFIPFLLCSQTFDDFTIDKEVTVFIEKHFSELKNLELGIKGKNEDNQLYLDSIEYSPWFVGDFNDDGLTDLFVQGYKRKENQAYLIMSTEEADKFQLNEIRPIFVEGDLNFPVIEETKDGPLIIYKQFMTKRTSKMVKGEEVFFPKNYNTWYGMGFLRKDTLVYKVDRLVEFNPKPNKSPLKFIQIHGYCQFGGCADFKLKIDSAGNMILQNIKNTELEKGIYKATCEEDKFRVLNNLINYLRFSKNEKRYGDSQADQVFSIYIAKQDGTEYKIVDYSQGGTLGLIQLYDFIEDIRKKTLW